MEIAVRYFSRGGNTKKVAEAIAEAVGVEARDSSEIVIEPVDILFLGGSVYGFGLDDHTKNYIANLNADFVKQVALFGTSAIVKNGNDEMAKLLKDKGIKVLERDFYCKGSFTLMNKGRPNNQDLKKAKEFAKIIVNEL